MNSPYNKYNPYPFQFALPPGDKKDAVASFWNNINEEAQDMVAGCAISNLGWDKFLQSTHKHFNKVIKSTMRPGGPGKATMFMFYPLTFLAVQLVHFMDRIDFVSYEYRKQNLTVKLFCCKMDCIQAILGTTATEPFIGFERRVDFWCDPTVPVLLEYIVEDQMLHIHYKYNDQRVYELEAGPTFAAANLPGWERYLNGAEAAQQRRANFVKRDQRLNRDFENGVRPNKRKRTNDDSFEVADNEEVRPMKKKESDAFWSNGRYH